MNLGRLFRKKIRRSFRKNKSATTDKSKSIAEPTDAARQFALGQAYKTGQHDVLGSVKRDPELMEHWYRKAAVQGHSDAQTQLAHCYRRRSFGVDSECQVLAVHWYQKAAEQGNVEAQMELARAYDNGALGLSENLELAFHWYQHAAKQGNYLAQHWLGDAYELGCGVPQNSEMSFYWSLQSVTNDDQKHPSGLYDRMNRGSLIRVAYGYLFGAGTPQDDKQAFHWLYKAADSLYSEVYFDLAEAYRFGRGVQQDPFEAVFWYVEISNAHEDDDDDRPAVSDVQDKLGFLHDRSIDVPKDLEMAVAYFRMATAYLKAAEQRGHSEQTLLGFALRGHKGLRKYQDYEESFAHFLKAAQAGDVIGQGMVGLAYEYGLGVVQSYELAAEWIAKAAQKGNEIAQYHLGRLHAEPRGVLQDYVTAHMWFNLAAAKGYEDAVLDRDRVATMMSNEQLSEALKKAREHPKGNLLI